jgi:hypothetical protein
MQTPYDIYKFLTKKAEDLAPMPMDGLMPPPVPVADDKSRIDGLRLRLRSLIGRLSKKASVPESDKTVFGDTVGELDPDAIDASQERWEVIEMMVDEALADADTAPSAQPRATPPDIRTKVERRN